jgi:hypothetical protein
MDGRPDASRSWFRRSRSRYTLYVFILGIILLILGAVLNVPLLWTIGLILVVVGAILWVLGSLDRGIGGRRHYY